MEPKEVQYAAQDVEYITNGRYAVEYGAHGGKYLQNHLVSAGAGVPGVLLRRRRRRRRRGGSAGLALRSLGQVRTAYVAEPRTRDSFVSAFPTLHKSTSLLSCQILSQAAGKTEEQPPDEPLLRGEDDDFPGHCQADEINKNE